MSEEKPLRIIELAAENVKRLKAVHITPGTAALVPISGRNAQGKTSVLDAIEMALAGARSIPARPIRDGEKNAQVVVNLGEFIVRRRFTPSGSTLEITTNDGQSSFKKPQEILDKICGELSFDPLAFTRLKARDQAAELARIAGIDLAAHEARAKKLEDDRKELGRDVKRLETEVAAISVPDGVPDEPIDLASITTRYEEARQTIAANAAAREELRKAQENEQKWKDYIVGLEEKLKAALETRTKAANARIVAEQRVADLVDPDTSRLTLDLQEAQEANALIGRKQERARKAAELAAAKDRLYHAQDAVQAHRVALEEAVQSASLPVPGLALTADGVTLHGVPFEQASGAEQLRTATAVAIAANPRLRVALIRDGSLLDTDSMAMLEKIATENDLQVWIEVVARPGEKVGVVIEDGEVVEAEVPAS